MLLLLRSVVEYSNKFNWGLYNDEMVSSWLFNQLICLNANTFPSIILSVHSYILNPNANVSWKDD